MAVNCQYIIDLCCRLMVVKVIGLLSWSSVCTIKNNVYNYAKSFTIIIIMINIIILAIHCEVMVNL